MGLSATSIGLLFLLPAVLFAAICPEEIRNVCENCNEDGVCIKCLPRRYLAINDPDGPCPLCSDHCDECSSKTTCTKCSNGYFLKNNQCNTQIYTCEDAQKSTCELCNVDNNCLQCKSGYYLPAGTQYCLPCSSKCTSCKDSHTCEVCEQHYDLVNGRCQSVPYPCSDSESIRCLDCNIDGYCIRCKSGFFLEPKHVGADGSGSCISCTNRCLNCDSKDSCLECEKGFFPLGSVCDTCNPGCKECKDFKDNCLECDINYLRDEKGDCYFRYSLVALIAGMFGFFLFVVCLCRCLNKIAKIGARGPSTNSKTVHDSILGDEFRRERDRTYISDVTGIGKTFEQEQDQDLSLVEDNQPSNRQTNELNDSVHDAILDEIQGKTK